MSPDVRDRRNRLPAIWLAGCVLLFLSGCASYSHSFKPIDNKLAANDPQSALMLLEAQDHSDRNQLLYLLNKAMLQRMQGDYAASNQTFEQAKQIIQTYSATSVTEQSAAFIVNDTTRTYIGIPMEQVMLHVYEALNYLESGDLDAARVEAMQVDVKLRQLTQDSPESALSVDPFARYLAGMIFEDLREDSDAMIAYRKAYEAYLEHESLYPVVIPDSLKMDLLRMSRNMGLHEEHESFKFRFGITESDIIDRDPSHGEVVLFFSNSLAPVKQEQSQAIVDPMSGILVRISLPYYLDHPNQISSASLTTGQYTSQTELVENINGIAHATLQAYMPAITARAIARALVKYQMARQAGNRNDGNDVAGAIIMMMNFATERADTRSWLTLPAEIQMARLSLPAGKHDLEIKLTDYKGQIMKVFQLKDFEVQPGKRRYISYHYTAH